MTQPDAMIIPMLRTRLGDALLRAVPLHVGRRGEQIVLDGSSVIALLQQLGITKVAHPRAPSDIDFNIYYPPHLKYRELSTTEMQRALETAVKAIGAEFLVQPDEGDLKFVIRKDYTPDEVAACLGAVPGVAKAALAQSYTVSLPVHLLPYSKMYFPPKTFQEKNRHGTALTTIDPAELLGLKLGFICDPQLTKPSHLRDALNLANAQPPVIDWKGADREKVQLAAVLGLASMKVRPEQLSVDHLAPREENATHLQQQFSSFALPKGISLRSDKIANSLRALAPILDVIIPHDANGRMDLPAEAMEFLSIMAEAKSPVIDRNIRTDLLQKAFPNAFAGCPELADNIRNSEFLREAVRTHADCRDTTLGLC